MSVDYDPADFPGFTHEQVVAGLTVPATLEQPSARDAPERAAPGDARRTGAAPTHTKEEEPG